MCIQFVSFKKLESFTPIHFYKTRVTTLEYRKLYIANTMTHQLCHKNIYKYLMYIPVCFVVLGPVLLRVTRAKSETWY